MHLRAQQGHAGGSSPQGGEQVAHLITQLRTPEDANKPIREGLIISGRHVWARKMKRELRRCLNARSCEWEISRQAATGQRCVACAGRGTGWPSAVKIVTPSTAVSIARPRDMPHGTVLSPSLKRCAGGLKVRTQRAPTSTSYVTSCELGNR